MRKARLSFPASFLEGLENCSDTNSGSRNTGLVLISDFFEGGPDRATLGGPGAVMPGRGDELTARCRPP